MARFVRRDIPALSSDELIARLDYDIDMKKQALKDAMDNGSNTKNVRGYSYHDNNERLLTDEVQRRHNMGEPVMWKYGKWRTNDDAYDLMKKEKNDLEERIKQLKFLLEFGVSHATQDRLIENQIDLDYVNIQIRDIERKYL